MFYYFVYGLVIAADLVLPDLAAIEQPVSTPPDIMIMAGNLSWRPEEPHAEWFNSELCASGVIYLSWATVGTYRVSGDGSRITYDAVAGVDTAVMRQPLLGAALACALRNKGYLVLHASAVLMASDGHAHLFLGRSGAGKSTLAAALNLRGHDIVVDDVVAIDCAPDRESPIRVLDGYSRCKLWPKSVEALGYDPDAMAKVHPLTEKFSFSPGAHPQVLKQHQPANEGGMPLGVIYQLQVGQTLAAESLSCVSAMATLITNNYVTNLDSRLAGSKAARDLLQCGRIVREQHVARLLRPSNLAALADTAELVERYAATRYASYEPMADVTPNY